ncbi:Na+-driven multidrug efflux pump [Pseudozobellia thermophila]|uniref:Na+-driven multidrug efflux pump n=1 Tax=Pseudozobellia thermophila TaxID=192903 RepID=A0A1M6KQF1_9FLAO|nr:Na+-driven multidrug efflux pump [Pseudozobellia thermophila]
MYAKMGITMFISLYVTRLVLNALGASDFGIFNVVGGAIAMLGFLHAAMSSATQRFMSFYEGQGDKEKQKYIFNVSTVLHLGIALLLVVVLLIAGYFFFNGILNIPPDRVFAAKVIYGALILSTAFTVLSVPYEAVLNAHENMLYYSIVGVVESLLKLAVALVIVSYAGDKLVLYGILMAVIPFIIRTIMQIYCHKKYEECVIAPKRYFEKGLMKEMTSFAGWSFLSLTSGMVTQYGMGLVLNNFFGAVLNAAQGVANQISGQLMVFSNNMLKAVSPVVVKTGGAGDRVKMLDTSLSSSKFSIYMAAFFMIPFMIEAPYVLKIWLKNIPEWAIVFVRLQLLRVLLEQFTHPLIISIQAQGDIRSFSIYTSLANIVPLFLTWCFFEMGYPPYFLYVSWIFMWAIVKGGLILHFAKSKCGLSFSMFNKKVALPGFFTCVLMVFTGLLPVFYLETGFLRLVLVGCICWGTFILLQHFIFLDKSEKKVIKALFLAIKQRFVRS